MVINSNIASLQSSRVLASSAGNLSRSLARLSSGSRILSPEDDAAGLAQSINLNNQSLRDNAAIQILQNGISFLQTKDGYLQKVQKALDRMSELSMLALDATKTDADRSNYNSEFQQLIGFINDIGGKTFNGKSLFYSEYSLVTTAGNISWTNAKAAAETAGGHLATITSPGEHSYIVQQLGGTISTDVWIGGTDAAAEGEFEWITNEPFLYTNWNGVEPNNSGAGEHYIQLLNGTSGLWNDLADAANVSAYLLETGPSLVISGDGDTIDLPTSGIPYLTDTLNTESAARTALTNVKTAIESTAHARGNLGATLQRMQYESETLSIQVQNMDAAVGRITDVDFAVETTNFARQSVLTQSATTILAQSNLMPQSVLRLLAA